MKQTYYVVGWRRDEDGLLETVRFQVTAGPRNINRIVKSEAKKRKLFGYMVANEKALPDDDVEISLEEANQ